MKYILSIDQGTTGSRAFIYDRNGKIVTSAYQEFPQYFPRPGWVEHKPQDIYKSVNSSIQKVLSRISPKSIAAIGITNQRETTIVWDRETGFPLCNAIVWQCRRTTERCNHLKKDKEKSDYFRKATGLPIDAYFSATKIEWILKNVPNARKYANRGRLCFGTTDSWILYKLTKGRVHATDYTNASRTMLFNINSLKWDKKILEMLNIPFSMLPQVKSSCGFYGETSKIGRLTKGIPITAIAGDQQAALFGQACFKPGEIKNTYGTGSFVLLNTGKKRSSSKHGLITTLGCGSKGEPVYVLEGAIFIAGAVIQWLRDSLKIITRASQSKQLADSAVSTDGVYFVPAFVGLGAPYWDQEARGAILGLTRGTNRKHIVRAALEAICYQTKDVIRAMEKDSGLRIKKLKVDGGVSKNNFLCQFQADILGIKVIRPKITEITSLGAAYLSGLAVGYYKSTKEIVDNCQRDRVFLPCLSKKSASDLYQGWLKAVERTFSK